MQKRKKGCVLIVDNYVSQFWDLTVGLYDGFGVLKNNRNYLFGYRFV